MILKPDCIYFPGDRPCVFNKREGQMCDGCPHYEVPMASILIVKLDAVGDVLRTTCVLHGLMERYPKSEITWITREASLELFKNNSFVYKALAYESTEAVLRCLVQEFDLVINLDTAWESCVLASNAKAKKKIGFGMDAKGNVFAFNPEAVEWLEMGAFDQLKKKNTRSYQDIMLGICGLKTAKKDIIINLSAAEIEPAKQFAARAHLNHSAIKIGINTGASPRWQFKQWTLEGMAGLICLIIEQTNWTVLLYGGPHEVKRNAQLAAIDPTRVIDTGTNNTLRQFFALVTLSDIFLTGDTLALHVATALKKKVVAYFGPTSVAEIDEYDGQILKVHSTLDCLCCYKPTCDFEPNCMNSMAPEFMFKHVETAASQLVTQQLNK